MLHDRRRDYAGPHCEGTRRFIVAENWTLRWMLVEVRKGADSPKPPQERGLKDRSHAAEAAPTKSIRSNTSRRIKVWGEPVSRSAAHL